MTTGRNRTRGPALTMVCFLTWMVAAREYPLCSKSLSWALRMCTFLWRAWQIEGDTFGYNGVYTLSLSQRCGDIHCHAFSGLEKPAGHSSKCRDPNTQWALAPVPESTATQHVPVPTCPEAGKGLESSHTFPFLGLKALRMCTLFPLINLPPPVLKPHMISPKPSERWAHAPEKASRLINKERLAQNPHAIS